MAMSTDLTFGQKLIESLEQAVAYDRGEYVPPRVHRVPVTTRQASVAAPPHFDAAHIQSVRHSLALSQGVFAAALGVSPSTVRAWEQGSRVPEGATRRLLQIAEEHPEYFAQKAQVTGK
ncbi:MAG: helix-turn-helix domain-containing protein [Chloroflexota bacterium]